MKYLFWTVVLRYHSFERMVEPYAYGRDKSGDEILRCYQISGGSVSGEKEGWKLLKVGEIFQINSIDIIFEIRKEFKLNDKAMTKIFEQTNIG